MRVLIVLVVLLASLLPSSAAAAPGCGFKLGFKTIADQIPSVVGQCLEDEHFNPSNGDALQKTAGGLLVWRKADNFTAFTDGYRTWVNGPFGLQSRLNTQSFPWEAAAATPPRPQVPTSTPLQTPSGRLVLTEYIFPAVDPPIDGVRFSCLKANPSCGRDDWWIEWNENQSEDFVQYRFVGPGLVTEARFIEAIWLLWRWPEGQSLLRDTAAHGVLIFASGPQKTSFAYYRATTRSIVVNGVFTETSTWMVADLLAHELRHAADDRAGVRVGSRYADCIASEQVAYQTESRFLRWLVDRFGSIPDPQMVTRLSAEDQRLYANLFQIATSPDVNAQAIEDYRKNCSAAAFR